MSDTIADLINQHEDVLEVEANKLGYAMLRDLADALVAMGDDLGETVFPVVAEERGRAGVLPWEIALNLAEGAVDVIRGMVQTFLLEVGRVTTEVTGLTEEQVHKAYGFAD